MLFRYGATENGNIEKKAHIYTQEEHGIDASLLDPDAAWVVRRLRKEGYHAYVAEREAAFRKEWERQQKNPGSPAP